MSASNEPADGGGPAGPNADRSYFRTIEDAFIRLRGAPLLLSPADWRQAQEWRKESIPLAVIIGALEEVFRKRKERGAKGGISSLRYCRRAVEAAWAQAQELLLDAPRRGAPQLDVPARLQALAGALPEDPLWNSLRAKILTVDRDGGEAVPEALVEAALAELDGEALHVAETALNAADRQHLEAALESALANLRQRLPEPQVEIARGRLRSGYLREAVGLPLLSLFAPEVETALEGKTELSEP